MSDVTDKNTISRPDAREVMLKLIQTTRLHRRVIEKQTAKLGMHCSGHRMLMHLCHVESTPSQKELAEHFKISCAAVATTLKRLEADGYIERGKRSDGGDCRVNEIYITELGRRAAHDTEIYFRCVDTAAVHSLTDEELSLFLSLLDRISRDLEITDSSFEP